VEISKGYVWLLHLGLKTALEYSLTLSLLEGVDLKQDLQHKILVNERLAIFYAFLALQNIFDSLNYVIFIREQFLGNNFQSFAQFHIGNGISSS
jgi:hypothetical protein